VPIVLGLDFETTIAEPINPSEQRVIEIGAILYDTEKKVSIDFYSSLVWGSDYPFDPLITELTGLHFEHLKKYSGKLADSFTALFYLIDKCDYILAHNGNAFDKIIFEAECTRLGVMAPNKIWLDSRYDLPYSEKIKSRNLTHLCADHGFLNPFPHRAIFDVAAMLEIFRHYDFEKVVKLATTPKIKVIARKVSPPWKDGGVDNGKLKVNGFKFNPENKTWFKEIFEEDLDNLRNSTGFILEIQNDS
jgi:DNA polymerase-3 subunit epsilon